MSLPGVRTVLNDRFYSISRQQAAELPKVVIIGRRDTVYDPEGVANARDYVAFYPQNELQVERQFGRGSELHKGYLEALSGYATQVYLVPIPANVTDADYNDTAPDNPFDTAFDEAELVLPDVIVPYGRGANETDWDDFYNPSTPSNNNPNIGIVADSSASPGGSMIKRVAGKVKAISERSHPCIAVMGVTPFLGAERMSASDIDTHVSLPNLMDRDDPGAGLHNYYVSVVAAEIRPVGFPAEFGWTNGAAHYAGFISSIASNRPTTNKVVSNLEAVRYSPNREQREGLVDKGVVGIGLDATRTPLWIDGVTFGKSTSDFTRLSTLRIAYEVMRMVRQVASRFIGEPSTTENRNAFETGITSGLRGFQTTGSLFGSDFSVTYYPREGTANVDLVLQPAFELRNINVTITVQL